MVIALHCSCSFYFDIPNKYFLPIHVSPHHLTQMQTPLCALFKMNIGVSGIVSSITCVVGFLVVITKLQEIRVYCGLLNPLPAFHFIKKGPTFSQLRPGQYFKISVLSFCNFRDS